MAAILKRALDVDAKLTPGRGGELSIWLDDRKVFDKGHHDGFPDEATVLAAIRGQP